MGASKVDGKIYGENSKFYGLKMFEKRMGGNMMNDTLVQSFLSVAAEGSFCKAAENLYFSAKFEQKHRASGKRTECAAF